MFARENLWYWCCSQHDAKSKRHKSSTDTSHMKTHLIRFSKNSKNEFITDTILMCLTLFLAPKNLNFGEVFIWKFWTTLI